MGMPPNHPKQDPFSLAMDWCWGSPLRHRHMVFFEDHDFTRFGSVSGKLMAMGFPSLEVAGNQIDTFW